MTTPHAHITARTLLVDITPPIGDYLCGGLHTTSIAKETPLWLRGLIFEQGRRRWVIASIEFCYLCGKSHDRFVAAVASAAAVPIGDVTVHSVHTHDAPLIDEEVHALYAVQHPNVHSEAYFQGVLDKTASAIRAALAQPGTRVAGVRVVGEPVVEFASSRRILGPDGRCKIRFSRCADPVLKAAPQGKIDPMLDQVLLLNDAGRAFATMQFYACHPQVSDGRRLISGDTVGLALELFEKANPGVFPVYFTGCAGDITGGKYTTGKPDRDRLWFGVRLFDAMQAGLSQQTPALPVSDIDWRTDEFSMPLRTEEHDAAHFRAAVADPAAATSYKYIAAKKLLKLDRKTREYPFRSARLSLGGLQLLFLPTELVIDYQLHAKQHAPGKVFVAAYSDSFLNYVATDIAFEQGGYEVDPMWTEVSPGCEGLIKSAIDRLLRA